MRKKGKRDKMMSIDKPNENTLIYIQPPPPPRGHTNIYPYRYTYAHIHIICYSSQILLFDINWVRQAVTYRGTNIRNFLLFHVSFAKRIFKFSKVIFCVCFTM